MKYPLAVFTSFFCLGISLASRIRIPFYLTFVLLAISLIISLLVINKGLIFTSLLLFTALILGVALYKNSGNLPPCHISKYQAYKNYELLYTIKGIVTNEPTFQDNKTTIVLKTEELEFNNLNRTCCGNILVHIKGKKDFACGEELILRGNLYRPYSFGSKTGKSYRDYLYSQGIYSMMRVETTNNIIRLNKSRGLAVKRFSLWLKHKMEDIIAQHVSSLTAGILDAMILGERRGIPAFINNIMIKSGTVHILPRLYTKMPPVAL